MTMMTSSTSETTLVMMIDDLFKPGRIVVEPIEGCLFVTKSGTEIGEIFMDEKRNVYLLVLIKGYVVPDTKSVIVLVEDLNDSIKIATEFINNIDNHTLMKGTPYGTIH